MLGFPTNIKIADRIYSIENWDARLATASNRYGECDKNNRIIRVDTQYGQYQAASTLLHEVMHGIWQEYSIEDGDNEERTIGFLQTALMQVFQDNPAFLAFINKAISSSCQQIELMQKQTPF